MSKILIVEDDKSIIKNLTDFLKFEGYEIDCASGQAQAIQMISHIV